MSLSSDVAARPGRLERFSAGERWLHRSVGVLVLVLVLTAALLYIPDLGGLVGNRQTVRVIHEIAGFALPIPLVLALLSRAFRSDAGILNRFRPTDWEWLRSRDRRSGRIPVDKFNAGQKLNAAFTLGAIIVLLATGTMMFFSSLFPDAIRTGATFVHDWLALAFVIVVAGHIYMALNDATARMGMRTGSVPVAWAQREHGAWAAEQLDASSGTGVPEPTPTSDDPTAGN
jgi:formate dehydrogenase subunit gamma